MLKSTRKANLLVAGFIAIQTLSPFHAIAAEWPEFRGPGGQGDLPDSAAPYTWGEEENLLWKLPLPGKGWSSPVVAEDLIWCTAGEPTGQAMTQTDEYGNEFDRYDSVAMYALGVSRRSGKLVHQVKLFEVVRPDKIHALNSYASPTPCIHQGRVFCHFGNDGTACVDALTGEVLWRKRFKAAYFVGAGSSPVVCDGRLILTCDGADQQYIVAVDPSNGETVWRQPRPTIRATKPDFRKSYSSPLVVTLQGEPALVIPGAQWIVAYRPADGSEIWRMDHGSGFSLVARPVTDGHSIFFCTGFGSNELWAVRPEGTGELGPKQVVWKLKKSAPNQPSPLYHESRLFTVNDAGVAMGVRVKDGHVAWRKRLGGNYSASIVRLNDRFYYFSREGVATMLDADGNLLGKNQLETGFMATPAIVDSQWIIRTERHLYCFGMQAVARAASPPASRVGAR